MCFHPQGSCGGPCGPLPPNPGKSCMVEPPQYGSEHKVKDHEAKQYGTDVDPTSSSHDDWKPNAFESPQDVEHKPLNIENTI